MFAAEETEDHLHHDEGELAAMLFCSRRDGCQSGKREISSSWWKTTQTAGERQRKTDDFLHLCESLHQSFSSASSLSQPPTRELLPTVSSHLFGSFSLGISRTRRTSQLWPIIPSEDQ